ncbi:hypothetical protein B0H67DRAFT_123962 [Lasiosphaeris hirsuta]|uniref:Uncharacterized protein n=1 Tax=Lasiosphaeris hirsuta TaxID=260670 RepID=A0AA40B080_9PEZI|nr:hypothetical protein B0H67DRAFT_123962 [Lasiosphaeris hirsuta]
MWSSAGPCRSITTLDGQRLAVWYSNQYCFGEGCQGIHWKLSPLHEVRIEHHPLCKPKPRCVARTCIQPSSFLFINTPPSYGWATITMDINHCWPMDYQAARGVCAALASETTRRSRLPPRWRREQPGPATRDSPPYYPAVTASPNPSPIPTSATTLPAVPEAVILERDVTYPDADELFPRVGFNWPVFRRQDWRGAWRPEREHTIALDPRGEAELLEAILLDVGRGQHWSSFRWRHRGLTRDEVDRAMAILFGLAAEAMMVGEEGGLEAHVAEPWAWWRAFRDRRREMWFGAALDRALYNLVVLAIQARQFYLERLGDWQRDIDGEGMWARAVDEVINVLLCRYAGEWGVLDAYFRDVEGAVHIGLGGGVVMRDV